MARGTLADRVENLENAVDSLRHVTRHMLGLYHGHPKARLWRRMLSDSDRLRPNRPELLLEALELVETPGYTAFTPVAA